MQTTLLGLGIAIILALVAALIGPYFIEWGQYRSVFEANASRLIGMPVTIKGRIDVRILPTPSVVLRNVAAAPAAGQPVVRADEIAVELALGPLMRGTWQASQLRIVRPQFELGLDADGRVALAGLQPRIDSDALTVERLSIEDGSAVLSDAASGGELDLDGFWFLGEVRSLVGPFRGEGGFTVAGDRYGYRLSTGRLGDDGIRIKLNVDPTDQPMTVETDGILALDGGRPRFEGTLALARPATLSADAASGTAAEPWRVTMRLKGDTAGILLDRLEGQYGPDDHPLKMTGTAELTLGAAPRFEGVFSARQIDLDRILALPEDSRGLPIAGLRALGDLLDGVAEPGIPMRIGIGIDGATFAGAPLQSLRGDFSAADGAWTIDSLEFRAPGQSQIRISGRLAASGPVLGFTGPVAVESSDSRALFAWIEGRTDGPGHPLIPLQASGVMTLASDKLAVERLSAAFDNRKIAGSVAYSFASDQRPARLDADIAAAQLDVDGMVASLKAAMAGTGLTMPGEMSIALDAAAARVAGVDVKGVKAKLALDAEGLAIERLSVADLGGAALDVHGRIASLAVAPNGTLSLDLDARSLDGLAAMLARFAPDAAAPARLAAARLAPAKLHATLSVDPQPGDGGPYRARLALAGPAGKTRLDLTGTASGDPKKIAAATIRIAGRVEADDGGVLAALSGLDAFVTVDHRAGRFTFDAAGHAEALRVNARLSAGGLDLTGSGNVNLRGAGGVTGAFDVALAAADARPQARAAHDRGAAMPVAFKSRVALDGARLTFADLSGTVAGAAVRGTLKLALGAPARVDGSLSVDSADLAALIAAASGLSAGAQGQGDGAWSAAPFGERPHGAVAGAVAVTVARLALAPGLVARDVRTAVRVGDDEIRFADVDGILAGGRLTGDFALRRATPGLAASGRIKLTAADAALIIPGNGRPPVSGRLGIAFDVEGAGASPAALIGSLSGSGTVLLEQAALAGLDPAAFDAVIHAVDGGLPIEAAKIGTTLTAALDAGHLKVQRADGAFTVTAGQVRWGTMLIHGEGAELSVAGNADLRRLMLDARLTLSGPASGAAGSGRPDVSVTLRGPFAAPARRIDVSILTNWLMLRAVERQAKRIETLESNRTEASIGSQSAPGAPTPPVPAAKQSEPASDRTSARPAKPEHRPQSRPRRPSARNPAPPAADTAPALPPPIEIRPAPAHHPAAPRAHTSEAAPPPPPPPASRSVFETLFGTQR